MSSWADMTAPTVTAAAADGAVALWPVGATEQHGSHLATGFDLAAAQAVCDGVDRRLGAGVVLLPGLALGASDHWLPLGGTLSLRAETMAAVAADVLRSIEEAGFEHVVVVNGHHGNIGPLLTALGASRERVRVEAISYWLLVDQDELARRCVADDGGIGHAGEVETSIGLHLGGLVTGEPGPGAPLGEGPGSSAHRFLRSPRAQEIPGGVLGDPRSASAGFGAWLIDSASDALADHCTRLRRV